MSVYERSLTGLYRGKFKSIDGLRPTFCIVHNGKIVLINFFLEKVRSEPVKRVARSICKALAKKRGAEINRDGSRRLSILAF